MRVARQIQAGPLEIAKKTSAILGRVSKTLEPLQAGNPAIFTIQKPRGMPKYQGFAFFEKRPRLILRALRQLPKKARRRFLPQKDEPAIMPTTTEFQDFERQLIGAIRRIVNREFKKAIRKLPPPAGRPKRRLETITTSQLVVQGYKDEGMNLTEAVEKAAKDLGRHPATIWRHLAAPRLSHASRRAPLGESR